ncbi:hypothetical protein FACS189454_04630 [Planctomycetales bacterium]|nr:hypothetical protein FACS189454_04630 [Planctomycetales bacterium]
MDDTRLRLNTGICRVKRLTKNGDDIVTNDNCFIAFDYRKNFYRFDVIEGDKGRAKTLRTPEHYFSCINLSSEDEFEAVFRSSVNDIKPVAFISPFDVRAVGLFVPYGSYWLHDYAEYRDGILKRSNDIIEVEEYGDAFVRLVFQAKNKQDQPPPVKTTFFVDTKRGFTVVKWEDVVLSRIVNTHETSWKQINNQWVPVSFVLSSNQGLSAEWYFEWESVNKDIPMTYFDPNFFSEESLDLFSREVGDKPIKIGTVGKDAYDIELINLHESDYFRLCLIYTGLFFIIISLIKILYDWYNKGKKK